ncbi:MAG: ATP-binding cassette domain-containing protein [Kofleriaceae bacterium]|nr:ATP-binding cassette domain-containing protein [Kofleriaceae bacterium]MBP6838661.1 ATP-binding cassette domain-containing protein [Kofleriaceae bacterium]MBP9204319.1 ATP-binding cassette domain-containing protein [Kofleriaceae bacterium]
MSAGAAVVVDGVGKQFGNHVAVDDLSFTVPTGVIYGVLGPNGAGKSTTLRMLNDIIAPDRGRIELLGGVAPGQDAAGRVGYLPEERGLYTKMPVAEMIAFMGELRGLTAADARRRAAAWLERLGLAQWSKNKVGDLSKGMQQKVQFACALIHDPELVILDEPWSGLDPINAEVLRATVLELKASGRTVLFSTHLMEQAEQICDQVCIIARGRKVLDGSLAAIKDAAGSGRTVALRFVDAASRAVAEAGPLADPALVGAARPAVAGDGADLTVELATGASGDALLAALVAARVSLRRFELVVPSLHQIFVDRVGDTARVAERREAS